MSTKHLILDFNNEKLTFSLAKVSQYNISAI